MNNEQMKQTLEDAQGWINSAKELTGELSGPNAAGVCAQIAIAQALSVIAATLVSVTSEVEDSRRLARRILDRSYLVVGGTNGPASSKIRLIKALRIIDDSLGLKEAKESVESMFDFAEDGTPTVK